MPDPAAPRRFDAIVVVDEGAAHVVGGLRLVERAAFALARAGAHRLLLVGSPPAARLRLPDVPLAWNVPRSVWLGTSVDPIVVMPATTVVDPATIRALVDASPAEAMTTPHAGLWRVERAWLAATEAPPSLAPPPDATPWTPPAAALLVRAVDAPARHAADMALYARLGRSGDGWLTRLVDRRISRALTHVLLPTGISPNQVTIGSIAIGMVAGWCFAQGTPTAAAVGAVLFLLSTIVDGCDGEIARLTFRESPFGAKLDILGDNLVHLVLFGGIAFGLHRRTGDPVVAALGPVLLVGVLVAMASVYLCIIRRTPNAAQRTLFEAFASREFAYLLVVLTLVGKLDWFLWMSAFGTYVFSGGLWVLRGRTAG